MGIFSGRNLKEKTGNPGGRWSPLGKHRVRIQSCKEKRGFQGESSIVEYLILRSNNSEVKEEQGASWVQNYSKNPQYRDVKEGNLADFIRAGFQTMAAMEGEYPAVDEIEFDDADVEKIFGEENIFAGLELDVDVFEIKTGAGQPFHKHVWSAPSELVKKAA